MKTIWTCPRCGRKFNQRNKQHTCARFPLEGHFKGKEAVVEQIYAQICQVVHEIGPADACPLKSRIVLQSETPFAAVVTHRHNLDMYLWLKRQASHPRLLRTEMGIFRDYGHIFRLEKSSDLDPALIQLIQEAYALASQSM